MILHCPVPMLQGNLVPAARQTGDLLQITKYRVTKDAAAHRFPQVSELIKLSLPPRLPLRDGLTGSPFELRL
jgi:hypothetical protein